MKLKFKKIFSEITASKKRKELISILRKKGNYLKNVSEQFKPVRNPIFADTTMLPCDNCLGFYSSKFLYTHRKKCSSAKKSRNSQAIGQNILIQHMKVDKQLKDTIFSHMRPDKISLEAKKDTLICAWASRYLKIHRDKHFVAVISRKMRELSKILIAIKKMNCNIKNFI